MKSTSQRADRTTLPKYEDIYLQEDRYDKPKELFKFIAGIMRQRLTDQDHTLLDIGCATGEFLYYIQTQFPQLGLHGIDLSQDMLYRAQEKMPEIEVEMVSLLDHNFFAANQFDLITCSGVLALFDEINIPLRNIMMGLSAGGRAYLATPINPHPIDVILRYRETGGDPSTLKAGWNIFSQSTFARIIAGLNPAAHYAFHDFRMPFAIPPTADPMRTWTIATPDNPHQLVNGACQLIHFAVVEIIMPG